MKQLSEAEYLATMAEPMKPVDTEAEAPFEFWDYFEAIPETHFEGHDCSEGLVPCVWEHPAGSFQHVLVGSEDENVFMVLVLDMKSRNVLGHRLLNLNREYGLDEDE